MSNRIVPHTAQTDSNAHTASAKDTAHPVSGLHDTFRHGLRSAGHAISADAGLAASGSGIGALQARLEKWNSTRQQLDQTMYRNTYGLGMPLRMAMDRKIVAQDMTNPLLSADPLPLGGGANVHLEILNGTDESLDAGDFMAGDAHHGELQDIHEVMAKKHRI